MTQFSECKANSYRTVLWESGMPRKRPTFAVAEFKPEDDAATVSAEVD